MFRKRKVMLLCSGRVGERRWVSKFGSGEEDVGDIEDE